MRFSSAWTVEVNSSLELRRAFSVCRASCDIEKNPADVIDFPLLVQDYLAAFLDPDQPVIPMSDPILPHVKPIGCQGVPKDRLGRFQVFLMNEVGPFEAAAVEDLCFITHHLRHFIIEELHRAVAISPKNHRRDGGGQ